MTPLQSFNTTEVEALLNQERWREAAQAMVSWPAPEIAALMRQAKTPEQVAVLRELPGSAAGQVFPHLDRTAQHAIVVTLPPPDARRLLQALEPDDIMHLLEVVPDEEREEFLALLSTEDRQSAVKALEYPEESVGRLMSPEYAAVGEEWTVGQALAHIRKQAPAPEMINNLQVVDSQLRLVGTLELRRFVLADPDVTVKQIMDRKYVALSPLDDREKAVQTIQKFDLVSLPVVDDAGVLLGAVTVDDVLDVAEEEATEDIHKQAAVAPLKAAYPQLGIWPLFQKRVPWIAGLVVVYALASGIVSGFEKILAAKLVLASFLPLLMGSAGNVGAQAGTLTVRALATGDLPRRLWLRVMAKETAVGLSLAVALAAVAGLIAYLQGGHEVAFVVGIAMFLAVIAANLFGFLLPLMLVSLGIDPAVAANPFITSFTDITSLTIYFTIATWLL